MKKAIVMGATSGIGREVAILLAKKGWQVGIAGRRVERLEEVMRHSLEEGYATPKENVDRDGSPTSVLAS